MKSLWNNSEAKKFLKNPLLMRVYTSRLLGRNSNLVLHGGGNTSVKQKIKTIFGEEEIIYVKGSGWDLASIEPEGFAPIKLTDLFVLLRQDKLTDTNMVKYQRMSMINPFAPNPSIEALLHALIPHTFVDHTHADAVLALTNTPHGEKIIKKIYGESVLLIPYIKPGFDLAKDVYQRTRNVDWNKLEGMILMNHGVFTFHDNAKISYENMIHLVSKAESYLKMKKAKQEKGKKKSFSDWMALSQIRKNVSQLRGKPVIAHLNKNPEHGAFSNLKNIDSIATRGPVTPDHVIRTKISPAIISHFPTKEIQKYGHSYKSYFEKFNDGTLTSLDKAPRWAVWKGRGTISFGKTGKEATIISDIVDHTIQTIQQSEKIGGWQPLSNKDLFEIEYWELEQTKLRKNSVSLCFEGRVALVTGAASGIGRACVENLLKKGAAVAALDINPDIRKVFNKNEVLSLVCDVTNAKQIEKSIHQCIEKYGGLDLVVSNAGIFPKSMNISSMNSNAWEKSLDVNLTSHQNLLKLCFPFLEQGIDPSVVVVGSKNVKAPGPGAGAYSVAKAGLAQLVRVLALEWGKKKIRINTVHPNAVFDTGIWTEKVLKTRAKNYGLSVAEYKTNNILGVEVTSADVAESISSILSPAFSKTTGAQIPIDSGNERVI